MKRRVRKRPEKDADAYPRESPDGVEDKSAKNDAEIVEGR